jgi:hypothetical protein
MASLLRQLSFSQNEMIFESIQREKQKSVFYAGCANKKTRSSQARDDRVGFAKLLSRFAQQMSIANVLILAQSRQQLNP